MKPLHLDIIKAIQGHNGSLDNIFPDTTSAIPIYRSLTNLLTIVKAYDDILPTRIPIYHYRTILYSKNVS